MIDGYYQRQTGGIGHGALGSDAGWWRPARSNDEELIDLVCAAASSAGHCNTMGTALSMNSLAEALGMSLPGCAAIPAPYGERAQMAYDTGLRIVDMVREDLTPSRILTREAFENAIVVNSRDRRLHQLSAAPDRDRPAHRRAARHQGLGDGRPRHPAAGERAAGGRIPGRRLSSRGRRSGRSSAELIGAGKIHPDALTVTGKTIGENYARLAQRSIRISSARTNRPLRGERRLPGGHRQSVRIRAGEDVGDQRRFPPALSLHARLGELLHGARHRLRRPRRLPPPHQRSRARDRRNLHAGGARRGSDRAIRARPRW